jgi:tetratricopeptide (TPR) repeat protein
MKTIEFMPVFRLLMIVFITCIALLCCSRNTPSLKIDPDHPLAEADADIFRARLVNPVGQIEIEIEDYTSADEVLALKQLLDIGKTEAFHRAMRSFKKGRVRFIETSNLTFRIRAAQMAASERGRKIEMFAESRGLPGFPHKRYDPRFPFLVIILDLDENDLGDGLIYESAGIALSPQGTIVLQNWRSRPAPLVDVRAYATKQREDEPKTSLRSPIESDNDPAKRGLLAVDLMNYERGVDLLNQAIRERPGRRNLRWRRGFALMRLGRLEEAASSVREELERHPADWTAWSLLAWIYYRQGRTEECEAACTEAEMIVDALYPEGSAVAEARGAIPTLPQGWSRHYYLPEILKAKAEAKGSRSILNLGLAAFIHGEICEASGRWHDAYGCYRKALALGYAPSACLMRQVRIKMKQGAFEEACRRAEEIIDSAGPHAGMCVLLAQARASAGDISGALDALETAVSLRRFDGGIMRALGIGYLDRGELVRGMSILRRAAAVDALNPETKKLLDSPPDSRAPIAPEAWAGDIAALCDEYFKDDGIRFLYPPANDPESVARMVNDAFFGRLGSGQTEDAAGYLKSYIEIDDSSPTIAYNLAQSLNSLERRREAFRYASLALDLDPEYRDALDLMGNLYFKIGSPENAVIYYHRALELNPADPQAHYNLGCAYAAAGRTEEAKERWREAIRVEDVPLNRWIEKPPQDPKALNHTVLVNADPVSFLACMALGCLLREGSPKEALLFFTFAAQLKPTSKDPYLELAQLLAKTGEKAKARTYAEKYVNLGGAAEQVADILRKL